MDELKILKMVLMSDYIKEYEEVIFEIIPEIENEKGFDQKNEWHSYDVWDHTIEAIKSCDKNFEDRLILLLHDIGKPSSCQEENNIRHFDGHAMKSAIMSKSILRRLGYKNEEIAEILLIIEKHATPIELENITIENKEYYKRLLKIQICDASAYEKEHAKLMLGKLKSYDRILKCKN